MPATTELVVLASCFLSREPAESLNREMTRNVPSGAEGPTCWPLARDAAAAEPQPEAAPEQQSEPSPTQPQPQPQQPTPETTTAEPE